PRIENFSRDWGVTVTASGACHLISPAAAIRKYQWWHMLAGQTPHWHAFCGETRRAQAIGGDNAIDQTGVGDEAGRTDERHFLEHTLVARRRSPPRGLQGPVRHGVDHPRRRGRGCGRAYTRTPAGRDRSRPRGHRRGSLWY